MNTTPGREYLHTLVAGVWLPLLQATVSALVVGVGIWSIAYFIFDMQDPHKPAITLFVIVWVYMFIKLEWHWLSLTTVEKIIQRDINGDGVIGEATPQTKAESKPRRVVIQLDTVKADGHYQVGDVSSLIKLSCSDEQLQVLMIGLENGLPFSEKQWCGKDKPFSTDDFRNLRAEMLAQGLTEYVNEKDKRQGIRLTDAGNALKKEYASPLPHSEV